MKLNVDLEMGKSEVEKTSSSKTKKEKLLFSTKVFYLNNLFRVSCASFKFSCGVLKLKLL